MQLLVLEIWAYLLVAFLLGMFVQWFFCCRGKSLPRDKDTSPVMNTLATDESAQESQVIEAEAIDDDWRPLSLTERPDNADELKRIKGIGAVIETTLNELGIYRFEQIAEWNEDNVSWVENYISFPGRIDREDWLEQARILNEGGTTEFAKRPKKIAEL